MSELLKTTLDHDSTDMLIDRWLEYRTHPPLSNSSNTTTTTSYPTSTLPPSSASAAGDAYYEWFQDVRERRHHIFSKQLIAWNKGEFQPENVFCRTVDTGRLIPLDRTWTTHVYHHHSMHERKLSMMPVVFTMLPELMLLRGMHDKHCDEIYVIVTDLKRQEMDDVANYFNLVCRHCFGTGCKPSVEREIQHQHTRLTQALLASRRTPCFPQIDLTFRAILAERAPPFLILFSHHTTSYSQIFFTHPDFVPDPDLFYDYPTGCPNPGCVEECEMVRFPRRGVEGARVLDVRFGKREDGEEGKTSRARRRRRFRKKEMCNWVDCDVVFTSSEAGKRTCRGAAEEGVEEDGDDVAFRERRGSDSASSAGEVESCHSSSSGHFSSSSSHSHSCSHSDAAPTPIANGLAADLEKLIAPSTTTDMKPNPKAKPTPVQGQICSKCKLVKYCSPEHQRLDWDEHKRVCVRWY